MSRLVELCLQIYQTMRTLECDYHYITYKTQQYKVVDNMISFNKNGNDDTISYRINKDCLDINMTMWTSTYLYKDNLKIELVDEDEVYASLLEMLDVLHTRFIVD